MLKITRKTKGRTAWLKLEGKLIGPWVEELRATCEGPGADPNFKLDLSDLTFVDSAGELLLRQLISSGHKIQACSSYLTEVLKENSR